MSYLQQLLLSNVYQRIMTHTEIDTFGALKKAGFQYKSIRQEIRDNLIALLKQNKNVFEGILGFEDTVIPDIERALLSGHNMNLLGLRGQAKTRMARQMIGLLDEYVPIVKGSEINDDRNPW
jgi:magnesium chelatase subunit I